jgi:hypothetical protein
MSQAQLVIPDGSFDSLKEQPAIRTAAVIAEILLNVYLQDVVAFVDRKVQKECQMALQSNTPETMQWAEQRLSALQAWKKTQHPLSYDALDILSKLVAATEDQHTGDVPLHPPTDISHKAFATHLVNFDDSKPNPCYPPIIHDGSLRTVLPIGIQYIKQSSAQEEPTAQSTFAIDLITYVSKLTNIFNVKRIPWTVPNTQQPGRRSRMIVLSSWMRLTSADVMTPQKLKQCWRGAPPPESPTRLSARQAAFDDPHNEWSFSVLRISEYYKVLHKRSPPTEWKPDAVKFPSTSEAHVKETYDWVATNIDLNNPIHHLAIIVGMLFAKCLPDIAYDKAAEAALKKQRDGRLTVAIQNTHWSPQPRRRCGQDTGLCFTMFATAMIALIEPSSPLQTYSRQHNNALGQSWTTKHGQ